MVEKFEVEITPFGLKRNVMVYLPKGYYESIERYPVVYMYDGHNLFYDCDATFGKCWGLQEFMNCFNKKMIIVGVECNHLGNNRLLEYFPYSKKPDYYIKDYMEGRGNTYMNWLTGEFKSFIDAKYRTLPDRLHTAIAGSSMGGLMSLYSVIKYNHIYNYAACLSSTIMLCPNELVNEIELANINPDTRIYMDYGGHEYKTRLMLKLHKKIEDALKNKGVNFLFYFDQKARHCEADWEKRIPIYMDFLFNY